MFSRQKANFQMMCWASNERFLADAALFDRCAPALAARAFLRGAESIPTNTELERARALTDKWRLASYRQKVIVKLQKDVSAAQQKATQAPRAKGKAKKAAKAVEAEAAEKQHKGAEAVSAEVTPPPADAVDDALTGKKGAAKKARNRDDTREKLTSKKKRATKTKAAHSEGTALEVDA